MGCKPLKPKEQIPLTAEAVKNQIAADTTQVTDIAGWDGRFAHFPTGFAQKLLDPQLIQNHTRNPEQPGAAATGPPHKPRATGRWRSRFCN